MVQTLSWVCVWGGGGGTGDAAEGGEFNRHSVDGAGHCNSLQWVEWVSGCAYIHCHGG